jgi:hypothetical protein
MVTFVFTMNEWWRNKLLIFSVFGRLLPWRYDLCYWWFGGKCCIHLQGIIEQEEKVFVIQEDGLPRPNNLNVQWYFTPVDIFGTIQSVMSKLRQDTLQGSLLWQQFFSILYIYIYIYLYIRTHIHTCVCVSVCGTRRTIIKFILLICIYDVQVTFWVFPHWRKEPVTYIHAPPSARTNKSAQFPLDILQ